MEILLRLTSHGRGVTLVLMGGSDRHAPSREPLALAEQYANELAGVIDRMKRRSEEHGAAGASDDPTAMAVALETLRSQHAELEVASEEIRAQLEELQRAGVVLAQERARSRHLFTDAPDAYLLTDLHGVVREANLAALQTFERDNDSILGKPLSTLIARDDVPSHFELLAAARDGAKREERLLRIRLHGPAKPLLLASATAARLDDGDLLFWRFRVPAPKKAESARPPVLASFPRLRVLVICHDDETRMPIELAASEHQAETRWVDTMSKALEVLREFPADVVVADMFIRSTAGVDVITELRASNRRPVPLGIAVSGLGAGDSRHALAVGFHAFLMKPVTIESARSAFQATARVLLRRSSRAKRTVQK